jgi:hypothetical protein
MDGLADFLNCGVLDIAYQTFYLPSQVFFMLWGSSGFWMCAGLTFVVAVFPNYLLG